MYGEKRGYEEVCEDMPFLLSQPRILSPTEFRYKLPNSQYNEYFSIFLCRKLEAFFLSYESEQWFKDRYLSLKRIQDCENIPSKVLLVTEINTNLTLDQIIDKYGKIKGVRDIKISLEYDSKMNFYYNVYIIPVTEIDIEKIPDQYQKEIKTSVIELDPSKVICDVSCSLSNLLGLLRNLCKYHNKTVDEVLKESKDKQLISEYNLENLNKQEITEVLQKYFLFCPLCCKHYDNEVEMIHKCSTHNNQNFVPRNIEILAHPLDVSQMRFQGEFDIRKFFKKTINGNFKCKICDKEFESMEYIIKHLGNKHSEETGEVLRRKEHIDQLLKHLDIFTIELVLGLYDKSVPVYGAYSFDKDAVVYDMPQVFSGKLNFK